jgi:Uma2 family endonuclease
MSGALMIHRMTAAEFLTWIPGDGQRWQLVDGEPEPMALSSEPHALIHAEAGRLIGNHLLATGSPCAALFAPAIQPQAMAHNNVRIADLAVTAAPPRADAVLTATPILIVEIVSPNDERQAWRNIWAYSTITTLQEILVIRQASIAVDLIRRGADGFWPEDPERIEQGRLHLASIDFSCDVAAFYRTTHLARPEPQPNAEG